MASEAQLDAGEPSDTIVVAGSYSDESVDDSNDSFDAYGEDEEEQEQNLDEPDVVNDDYAKTFDSPAEREHQGEADESQPDVSKAAESMNSSSAPDTLKSQSPPTATSVLSSSPPPGVTDSSSAQGSSAPFERTVDNSPIGKPAASNPDINPSNAPTPLDAPITEALTNAAIQPAAFTAAVSTTADQGDGIVDIQKLVDDITARAASAAPSLPAQAAPVASQTVSTLTVSPSASLPPKPSISLHPSSHLPAIPQAHPFQRNHNALPSPASAPPGHGGPHRGSYLPGGAPGTTNEGLSSLPPPPSFGASHHQSLNSAGGSHLTHPHSTANQSQWETFLIDEKRYTTEAKWERFPEGSRIFIGNLSSERVSKREVFDVFSRFGHLAQISLKNAYGFVQYHTISEGQAAMQGAQGIEMGGRKIHLEISRAQKKKDKDDREHSPERRGSRVDRTGRPDGRFDGRDPAWRRDDYRPGRSPSPRRSDGRISRDGFGSRDRDLGVMGRRRSRSPARFGRPGPESYRNRSPSPHRRATSDGGLDLPRRYGSDVPDVQFLLIQEVSREFTGWVQHAFHERGLRTDIMFVSPRLPRDAVVQRQIVEGVHAIVELDYAAQAQGKISIQVFSRPAGSNVRYDTYQGVDPSIAAELVLREKTTATSVQPTPHYPSSNYGRSSYPTEPVAPTHSAGYPYQYPQAPAQHPQAHSTAVAPDLTSVVGQLDNTALQALLASLQAPQGMNAHQSVPAIGAPAGGASQLDINALLGTIRGATPAVQPTPTPGYPGVANYGSASTYSPHAGSMSSLNATEMGFGGGDTAQQVQSIMEQLKRATQ
ncbi:hypothetical protein OQA88_9820 [Cercophora sp. LCS_1]